MPNDTVRENAGLRICAGAEVGCGPTVMGGRDAGDGIAAAGAYRPSGNAWPTHDLPWWESSLMGFDASGVGGIPDDEMLEMMLWRSVPGHEVKRLARRLIETFGDVGSVIAASPIRLAAVHGMNLEIVGTLKLFHVTARCVARARIMYRPVLSSWRDLIRYLRTVLAHQETEQMRILFLNIKNVLIADEAHGRGTVNHVAAYPREVVKRALELNASAIILVHNHPSGDPTPSTDDIRMTERISSALDPLSITVHDHVIIASEGEFSMRTHGFFPVG